MEILRIDGDLVFLLFHASEAAEVGETFQIIEKPDNAKGIVVQIVSNDSHQYPGIEQELIQIILENRLSTTNSPLNQELGLGEIRNLKVAKAKIRKKIENSEWMPWDGWIPTRNVEVTQVSAEVLCDRIMPSPSFPITFLKYKNEAISIDGPMLDQINVITGVKGSGKSHVSKHLAISLSHQGIPCVVFDVNGEYSNLPNVLTLRWGENFLPDLAELDYWILLQIVDLINPLPETSRAEFEHSLAVHFGARKRYCEEQNLPFSIDIPYLQNLTWAGGTYVQDAIRRRLEHVNHLNLFVREGQQTADIYTDFNQIYEAACNGSPLVIDLRSQKLQMQKTLTNILISQLEKICKIESENGGLKRFPFVFFEEAHLYIDESGIMNIITRGRHIGISSVFVTNTPEKLPDNVFRQLDNLFLLNLTHKDDIRRVSENSFTDEETIESFSTRMLPRHALIIGRVTDRYPIIFDVDPLPPNVPPTGVTRTPWSRFVSQNH
jgi:hypothetical protein